MENRFRLNEQELLIAIQECPSQVLIQGNRQSIRLSYQGICVEFPVKEQIYTRWVCSLGDAQILSTGELDQVSSAVVRALAQAAINRPYSSYDLKFEEIKS